MKKFVFNGQMPASTVRELKKVFGMYGLNINFRGKKGYFGKISLVDEIPLGGSCKKQRKSILGCAIKEDLTAYVVYPIATKINSICFQRTTTINCDRLFALVCVHEALHLFGLGHCKNKKCLMAKLSCDSNKSGYCLSCLSIGRQKTDLCESCAKKLYYASNSEKSHAPQDGV